MSEAPIPPRWRLCDVLGNCLRHESWPVPMDLDADADDLEGWEQEAHDILAAVAWVRKNGARVLAESGPKE